MEADDLFTDVMFAAIVGAELHRTLWVHPDGEARLRAVLASDPRIAPYYTIKTNSLLPHGEVYIIDDNALEADANEARQRLLKAPMFPSMTTWFDEPYRRPWSGPSGLDDLGDGRGEDSIEP